MKIDDNSIFIHCRVVSDIPRYLKKISDENSGCTVYTHYNGILVWSGMPLDAIYYRLGFFNLMGKKSTNITSKVNERKEESRKRWENKVKEINDIMRPKIREHYLKLGKSYFDENRKKDSNLYNGADATYKRWHLLVENLLEGDLYLDNKELKLSTKNWTNPNCEMITAQNSLIEDLLSYIKYADTLSKDTKLSLKQKINELDKRAWEIGDCPTGHAILKNYGSVVSLQNLPNGREAAKLLEQELQETQNM